VDLNLKNKFGVITGGSSGIGFAVAEELAREGVDVAIIARTKSRLEEAAKEIEENHDVGVLPIQADVTDKGDISRAISEIKSATGRVDILINNAGTGSNEDILDSNDEKWQYFWDLHVMAAVRFVRGLVPMMRGHDDAAILNTASICAKQPLDYEPIYNTTKAALVMFSKSLANELVDDGIRVNAVNPGLVRTADWKNTASELTEGKDMTEDEYFKQIAEEKAPIGRFAEPEEIAHFYAFLCSPLASYCIGSTYYIDGGWLNTTV